MSVAFGVRGQVSYKYSQDIDFSIRAVVGNNRAADHILIHAGAADFLAHPIDNQQINGIQGDLRQQAFGFAKQDYVLESYRGLFDAWLLATGSNVEHMRFAE